MATASTPGKTDSVIDGDAFDLICCFYDGVDDIVHEHARQIAEGRRSFAPDDPTTVLITRDDVVKAGCAVVEALRSLLANRQLPSSAKLEELSQMTECFDQKL
ncbi:hypothetical protein GC176_00095 [bacterium]|nr:hypothetical protein [bacterium]